MRTPSSASLLALFALLALLALLAPTAAADVSFPLFDGKSLSGWAAVHDGRFSVRDGLLGLDGGMGWLRTEQRYRDFVLALEWRALAAGYDSGIFFRAPLGVLPWPRGYQVNLSHAEVGTLVGVKGAGGKTPACVKPQGEWNRFELRVAGKDGSLKVNGVDVWKTSDLEERDGFIGIQAEEHRFELRKIEVTDLGYQDLAEDFRGREGKHAVARGPGDWEVKPGGLLVNSGPGGGWLGTRSGDWGDFSLKLEYRVPRDGNSGVFLRCPLEGNPAYEGMEIQIVDDDTTRWKLGAEQLTGAIYAAVRRTLRATRTAGTWESMEITAKGPRITVHVNGLLVTGANLDEHTEKVGEAKPLKDRPRTGHIGLQSYGTGIELRNVRVKRLP
ncbi:MAG: DUF1080 domain-containing protein [Planctomycetes bacterium]|nr:DUF1080 domain-containing protein [Planctomycetota bacterium]